MYIRRDLVKYLFFSGETLYCIITFILVYYSLTAAMVWFVILTYVWHMSFQALGKIKDRIDKKGAYFHLIAWCLPTVLTVTIMTLGQVDGSSVTGICFVGYANHTARASFVLGPLLIGVLVGVYFLCRGRCPSNMLQSVYVCDLSQHSIIAVILNLYTSLNALLYEVQTVCEYLDLLYRHNN